FQNGGTQKVETKNAEPRNVAITSVVTPANNVVVTPCDCCQQTGAVNGKNNGKEQVIWWEEKNGQRVSPVIVTSGKNPFDAQNTVRIPGKKPEVIVEQPINRNGMPVVLDCTNQAIVEAKPKLGERLAGLLRGNSNTVKCGEVTVVSDKAVSDKSASDKIA